MITEAVQPICHNISRCRDFSGPDSWETVIFKHEGGGGEEAGKRCLFQVPSSPALAKGVGQPGGLFIFFHSLFVMVDIA